MKVRNREGYDELETKIMLKKPITPLSKLIGQKWFLSLDKLAEKSGVSVCTLKKVLNGYGYVSEKCEQKIRDFLEKL